MAGAPAASGLSGHAVRGAVDAAGMDGAALAGAQAVPAPGSPEAVADAAGRSLEETVRQAGDFALRALDLTGEALGKAVDVASDKAFQEAAAIGPNIASPGGLAQNTFSWTGYLQAIGIMCLLLAALWFAVWAIRKYGKFNFLPRPGSLPRGSLIMEAQMPLGPRKGLMVVKFMNRRLLLGVTDSQITLLTEDKDERTGFKDVLEGAANPDSGNRPA